MVKIISFLVITLLLFLLVQLRNSYSNQLNRILNNNKIQSRFSKLLACNLKDVLGLEIASGTKQKIGERSKEKRIAGFFVQNMRYIYRLTNDNAFKSKVEEWMLVFEKLCFETLIEGEYFKIFPSTVKIYNKINYKFYNDLILNSAELLWENFNEEGYHIVMTSKRSDDQHKNLIDIMMDVEVLLEAAQTTGQLCYQYLALNYINGLEICIGKNSIEIKNLYIKTKTQVSQHLYWLEIAVVLHILVLAYKYTKHDFYQEKAMLLANNFLSQNRSSNIPYTTLNFLGKRRVAITEALIISNSLLTLNKYFNIKSYKDYSENVLKSIENGGYLMQEHDNGPYIIDTAAQEKELKIETRLFTDFQYLNLLVRLKRPSKHTNKKKKKSRKIFDLSDSLA